MELGDGLKRHPVTIYEIVFLICLLIGLKILESKYSPANGNLFKIFMISYILFRFLLDFIKPLYTFSIGLSTIQIACIAGICWYLGYIIRPGKLVLHS